MRLSSPLPPRRLKAVNFKTTFPKPRWRSPRYPAYFAADLRVARDVNINPRHAVRLSVTLRNLTNHNNPLAGAQ